ncbi:MAG: polyprenyl synthetase family protein [Alphaproteobacteria bacterium]
MDAKLGWTGVSVQAFSVATFDLNSYMRSRRSVIDRALERYFTAHEGQSETIWRAMRYGLFPGGKRIRPMLTLAAGEVFGGKQRELVPFACAVEMVHAYSLIHDDLPALDDDDLRRGAPTAHKVFGEGVALLAGDGLLTEAFHVLSAPSVARALSPELVLELIHELSQAIGVAGLVGGQAFDLEAENQEVDLAMVEYIHVKKTGALILASVKIGARVAGAKAAELKRISRYGEYLGLAFQIADDIVDFQGEAIGGDGESAHKERKKATYPSVIGVVQAKEQLNELLQRSARELVSFGSRAEPLKALAGLVGKQALRGHDNPTIQEMEP